MPARTDATTLFLLTAATLCLSACRDAAAPDLDVPGGFVSATAGSHHHCAITTEGSLVCWGRNYFAQLGDGTTSDRHVPVAIAGLANVATVSGGDQHTCAVDGGGVAYCWGNNAYGQLGTGWDLERNRPTAVGTSARFTAVAVSPTHSCGIDTEGRAHCWGSGEYGQLGAAPPDVCSGGPCSRLPIEVEGDHRFARITAGSHSTCGITLNGTLYCWGRNLYGELGSETGELCNPDYADPTPCATTPVPVPGGRSWEEVSAGGSHACAIAATGQVFCWGRQSGGLLGDGGDEGGNEFRTEPAPVAGGRTYNEVSAGLHHTCAIACDGSTYCWGAGMFGDGSVESSAVPVPVTTSVRFLTVAVGVSHACGVTRAGMAYCWGSNQYGQLGDGSYALGWSTPVAVKGGER